MGFRVTNLNGTSDNDCNCVSWLEHWKEYANHGSKLAMALNSIKCAEEKCGNVAKYGGHVKKVAHGEWFIIPLCASCNQKKGFSFNVKDGTSFASANVADTCGE